VAGPSTNPLSAARTAAWGLLVLAATGLAQALTTAAMAAHDEGTRFGVGVLVSASVGGALLLALLRGRSPRVDLALTWPRATTLIAWVLIAAATAAALDCVALALGRPRISDEWFVVFHGAQCLPALLLALVVVAPVYEEMFFRGLLHRGLAASRAGPVGAVLGVAALFSLAHFPADAWSFAHGLALGVLLGAARQSSGSLVPCIVVHALLNARVVLELALGEPR
jgi:uncharacterized protein